MATCFYVGGGNRSIYSSILCYKFILSYLHISLHTLHQDIHIFIPAYNEEKSIRQVILEIRAHGFQSIYVVDDGSTDRSTDIAQSEGATIISHIINRGVGAATQTAIAYARKNKLAPMLLMDADAQHDPQFIATLFLQMKKDDADMVIGSRFLQGEGNIPFSRKMYNALGNFLMNLTYKNHYTDTQSGFRLLNKNAIHSIDLKIDNFAFCSEMILIAEKKSLKISEAPITVRYSEYSLSKGQGFVEGLKTIFSFWWKLIYGS